MKKERSSSHWYRMKSNKIEDEKVFIPPMQDETHKIHTQEDPS
jgi:hypothetical protein